MERSRLARKQRWPRRHRGLVATVVGLGLGLLMVSPARALRHGQDRGGEDHVAIFSTIHITESAPADDVVCAFCTVQVDGDVHGDVAAMFSTVEVGPGRTISGDVATLFSTLRLGEGAEIQGDLATALGHAELAPGARVEGDRAILGSGLGLLVVLGPLLILAGLVWLLVWFARRVLV